MASGGVTFVRRQRRICSDHRDLRRRDVEFFRRALDESSLHAGAEFGLSGEHGNVAVSIQLDPGVQRSRQYSKREAAGFVPRDLS